MMPRISRHAPSVISANGCSRRTAALLTKMSIRPNRSAAAAAMRATAGASVTSAMNASARPPPSSISRATALASVSLERALITTAAPAAASSWAIARPMLRAAPVTMATRPSSSFPLAMVELPPAFRRENRPHG